MKTIQSIVDDLQTRGFSTVPGFLSGEDVGDELRTFLASAPKFADGVINDIPGEMMSGVRKRIESLVPAVANLMQLSISRNVFQYCAIRIQQSSGEPVLRKPFSLHRDPKIAPGGALNWHLDHFSYYLHGDHKNWLICYMPVVKPSVQLTNLAIIPSDVLEAGDPDLAEQIRGRGAMRFRRVDPDTLEWFAMRFSGAPIAVGDWFAIDDFDDATMGWKIKIDLEQRKVVPMLAEDDLLIMRADVIHRTNDAGCNRISIRCDAIPLHARRFDTLPGLLRLSTSLCFAGEKRRYNLRSWVRSEWKKRLRRGNWYGPWWS